MLTAAKRPMPQPVIGSRGKAQSDVAMVFSRSWISLGEPTPPAARSALVNVDQFAATATTMPTRVSTKPARNPLATTAPIRTTSANDSHTTRVCVRYTA